MDQFTFSTKEKRFSLILMAIGVISLVVGLIMGAGDGTHQARVWTNILHNTVFFTGIGFITLFLFSAHTTAYSGWHTAFKRVWEAIFTSFLPVGFIFLIIITLGLLFGWHHMYHWALDGVAETDEIIAGKSGFLNKTAYTIATVVIMGLWILFANRIRTISKNQDEEGYEKNYNKMKFWTAVFLPVGGFTSFAVVVYWVMSVDPHWYSTLFAWYNAASWLVSAVALTILLLIYLKSKGYLTIVNDTHFHDLGKYMFGFSVFWAYLWFSQFMLIWYANVGEETVYFQLRMEEYSFLFFANLIINFAIPFLVLIRNTAKRRMGIMAFIAGMLVFGHWIDFYLMTKPGVLHEIQHAAHHGEEHDGQHGDATIGLEDARAIFTGDKEPGEQQHHEGQHEEGAAHAGGHDEAHGSATHDSSFVYGFHFPGFIEIGMMLGFLGVFLFAFFTALAKANLVPKHDPYLGESENHKYDVQGF